MSNIEGLSLKFLIGIFNVNVNVKNVNFGILYKCKDTILNFWRLTVAGISNIDIIGHIFTA